MARKRMIDPEFWSDEKVAQLSYTGRLLFIGTWNFADDEGIIKCRPEFLKSCIFPYDEISIKELQKEIDQLIKANLVFPYTISGQKFLVILNFRKHQVINKPLKSKLPRPSIQNTHYHRAIFERDNWTCHLCGDYIKDELSADGNQKIASVDHLEPVSLGGNNMPYNLKTACLSCNKSRGNKPLPSNYGSTTVPNEIEMKGNEIKRNEMKGNTIIPPLQYKPSANRDSMSKALTSKMKIK